MERTTYEGYLDRAEKYIGNIGFGGHLRSLFGRLGDIESVENYFGLVWLAELLEYERLRTLIKDDSREEQAQIA